MALTLHELSWEFFSTAALRQPCTFQILYDDLITEDNGATRRHSHGERSIELSTMLTIRLCVSDPSASGVTHWQERDEEIPY